MPQFAASNAGDFILGADFNANWWSEEHYVSGIRPTGDPRWRRKVPSSQWGFDQGIFSCPMVAANGDVIVNVGLGKLERYDRVSLQTIWSLPGNTSTVNNSPPAILPDQTIRFMQGGTLHALNSDGTNIWTAGILGATLSVAPNQDVLVEFGFSSEAHVFPARTYFNANGTVRWTQKALHGGTGKTNVFGPDGRIYTGAACLNPVDGSVVWLDTGGPGSVGAALGQNNQVYGYGSSIRAYNKDTGAILWSTALPGTVVQHIAIGINNSLYVTTNSGDVVALTSSGAVLWQLHVCDRFKSGPVIGVNGALVASGLEGFQSFVYCIE